MKNDSFLAGALLLAAPVAALFSGCGGGGGSLSPVQTSSLASSTATPTAIGFPTPTSLPTRTPLPVSTPIPTGDPAPEASLVVVTKASDGSSFGMERFHSEAGVAAQGGASYNVLFGDTTQPYRSIRIVIPKPSTVTIGKAYPLARLQATMLATLTPAGVAAPISWGGDGYSQGRLQVVGFVGNRFAFELQDVVLSRRPSKAMPKPGKSQLKISQAFVAYINKR